jgi:hypothetical protein
VVNFEQTQAFAERIPFGIVGRKGGIMPVLKNDKHKEYSRYAAHLQRESEAKDPETRTIEREMTAEWMKLADAVLHPLKRTHRVRPLQYG